MKDEDGGWLHVVVLFILIILMASLMPIPQKRPPTPPESLYTPYQR